MSDRLAELRRQRALLEEHLAWLDREMGAQTRQDSAARGGAPNPIAPLPRTAAPARALSLAPGADAIARPPFAAVAPDPGAGVSTLPAQPMPVADAVLDKYRVAPEAMKSDVRKGCFLYFVAAFVLLGLGVTILWWALKR